MMVAWVIGDGMIIDDSWLRISATKCSLASVGFLGYRRRKFNYKIGYRLRLKPYLILLTVLHISKNLTVELHVLYALNTHVKFCVNWILFTI